MAAGSWLMLRILNLGVVGCNSVARQMDVSGRGSDPRKAMADGGLDVMESSAFSSRRGRSK